MMLPEIHYEGKPWQRKFKHLRKIKRRLLRTFQLETDPLVVNGFIVLSTNLMDQLKDTKLISLFEEIIK